LIGFGFPDNFFYCLLRQIFYALTGRLIPCLTDSMSQDRANFNYFDNWPQAAAIAGTKYSI